MAQMTMFDSPISLLPVVNVASIPQRSPFRYPGGKTWLVPHVRRWLRSMSVRPGKLIEPFAGGGIISLTVAFEKLADSVLMVEMDDDVAAVWETILSANNKSLAEMIVHFQMNTENVLNELNVQPENRTKQAFLTILRNRVSHGGIMANGSGLIKNGENGKGIGSRWYPRTLSRRIREIDLVADRIKFVQADGLSEIQRFSGHHDIAFFVDPPYTAGGKKAGRRLYAHNELDHERLFSILASAKGDFLMTYDYSDEILALAGRHGFDVEAVAMTNTHHARMNELLVGRDLSWVRQDY